MAAGADRRARNEVKGRAKRSCEQPDSFCNALKNNALQKLARPNHHKKIQPVRILLFLIALIATFYADAQIAYDAIAIRLDSLARVLLYDREELRTAHVGISIFNPTTETFFYNYQGEKYFTPASNTKILTLYAGLTTLSDYAPALRYIETADTLFFQSTGDPSFLHPLFPTNPAYSFLKWHSKPLVYVPPRVDDAAFGPNWSWDDYAESFQPERSAMPIYGNMARFYCSGDSICSIPACFSDSNCTAIVGVSNRLKIQRDYGANTFQAMLPVNSKARGGVDIPFVTSDSLLLRFLADTLNRAIGLTEDRTSFLGRWSELPGLPIDTIYRMMMYESDNFLAEQVLRMSAQKTLDRMNTADFIDFLLKSKLYGSPQPIAWYDGSGLSRFNLISPKSMAFVLNKMYKEQSRTRLFSLFPTGGIGTLANRYGGLRGRVFAKTGTLRNNVALSGFLVLPNDQTVIFSILVSNHNTSPSKVRAAVEIF